MRLVDADYICKCLYNDGKDFDRENGNEHFIFGIETALELIHDTPTADAKPVRHGHWTYDEDGNSICSYCGLMSEMFGGADAYCRNCGTRMDEHETD